jgi:hypothetical protein
MPKIKKRLLKIFEPEGWFRELLYPEPRWIWVLRSFWILIFFLFIYLLFLREPLPVQSGAVGLDELVVYSGGKGQYALWERAEAIKFGFEQLSGSIKYLFVAAAAILGFISKILIEPLIDKKGGYISLGAAACLRHTAIGCFFSMFYGFFGITYLIMLPDSVDFSFYEEIGGSIFCQAFSFMVGAMLMIMGGSKIIKERERRSDDEQKPQVANAGSDVIRDSNKP